MFDRIAGRYDLLNRLLSVGIDRRWRREAVRSLGCRGVCRVLDLATGTADLALAIALALPQASVVGIDPSEGMLAVGRRKVARRSLTDRVRLEAGDAQSLDAPDGSFDASVIAFGIRNVPDRARALQEMARVTTHGGRVVVLELGEPQPGPFGAIARLHVHHLVPLIGGIISGRDEYRYLTKSIAAFPSSDRFAQTMAEAGLDDVRVLPLTFGAVNLYVGEAQHPAAAEPSETL